jgi:cytochrome c oxidase subunit 2
VAVALASTPAWATYGTGNPSLWHPLRESVTEVGFDIDRLYWGILLLTGAVFIAVQALLLYFTFRYRAVPGGKAKFIHGNNKLEATWTIIPSVILVLIAALSKSTWNEIRYDAPTGEDAVRIECVAQQFAWFFRYPGNDGQFGPRDSVKLAEARANNDLSDPIMVDRETAPPGWTGELPPGADDYTNQAEVRIPADRPVRILLTSNDVLHSFYVPEFRVKHDAVPGMNGGRLWFEVPWKLAKSHGYFDLICAELCGLNHYSMRGRIIVMPTGPINAEALEKDAATWLAEYDDDEFAVRDWLDKQTWETYVHVMSKITAAQQAASEDDYY